MSATFDVIIVGAGSVGTPLAWQLAAAGRRTLVLDAGASAGQGSNKVAIGGIRATHSDPAKIRLCLESIEIFSTWQARYGDSIGWQRGGYVFVAYREREEKILRDLLAVQKRYGLEIDWHDRDALRARVPALCAEGLRGGVLSPGDGNASPLLAIHAFERQARAQGATFHFRERVVELLTTQGRVQGVRTDKETFHAPLVVNAAGPWAREVGALAGLDLPVQPDSHEAGVTEPVAPFLGPMVVDIRPVEGSANYYFYQHYTGQVIFCITPNPPLYGTDRRETSVFLPQVSRRMIEIMPRLRNLKVRRTWRGLYPMTPDGAPIVGRVREVEGLVLAVGMCGQGFMLGPGLAVYLRRYLCGELDAAGQEVFELLSPYRNLGGQELLK